MSFPPYPQYKDSGVEWLGDVPEHWVVDRLKWSRVSCRNGIWGSDAIGDENDIPCVRVADFDRDNLRVNDEIPTTRNVAQEKQEGRVLSRGDLLLEKSGGGENQPVGCVVLYDHDEPAVCSNFVAKMVIADDADPSFWRYVHQAAYAVRLNTRSIKQTSGIQNLDQNQYLDEQGPFPPLDEQRDIASLLDRETSKLDALVSEQRRLIGLLKEKRQALISHAVTQGLNPNAPTKPTNIPWLGNIPEHWEVKQIKRVVKSIEQGWSPQCENYPVEDGVTWAVLKVGCVNYGMFNPLENKALPSSLNPRPDLAIAKDDILISRANTRELVGSTVVAEDDFKNLILCDKLYRLRVDQRAILPKFVSLIMSTRLARGPIEIAASGASQSMVNIGQGVVLNLAVAVPPLSEQITIVEVATSESRILDALIAEAESTIALLQERRSALISAAVTGKIDSRPSTA